MKATRLAGESITATNPSEFFTETGFRLPDAATFDQWVAIGDSLQRAARSVRWWIGDWLLYGEKQFGETYSQAIETTGATYQYLSRLRIRVESR